MWSALLERCEPFYFVVIGEDVAPIIEADIVQTVVSKAVFNVGSDVNHALVMRREMAHTITRLIHGFAFVVVDHPCHLYSNDTPNR